MTDPIASDYSVTTALQLRFDDDTTIHAELCFDIADPLVVSVVVSGQHSVQVFDVDMSLVDDALSGLEAGAGRTQVVSWDGQMTFRLTTERGLFKFRCDTDPVRRLVARARGLCPPEIERLAMEAALLQWLEDSGLSTDETEEPVR